MARIEATPLSLREANTFVRFHHRHNGPTARNGGKFAIAACSGGEIMGVVIVGNPLSATLMDGATAEITRLCVRADAPRNTCSFLCGRAWRIWRLMGGEKLISYTLATEHGCAMKAAGFRMDAHVPGHNGWSRRSDGRRRTHQTIYGYDKIRWIKEVV